MDTVEENKRRIHIMGSGSIGCFVAHAIRGLKDPPPTTLLLHRKKLLTDFKEANHSINVTTDKVPDMRGGFDAELVPEIPSASEHSPSHDQPATPNRDDIIYNLIISVKAPATAKALKSIKHRLVPESTILFLQNGMGVVEEINESVFPEPQSRPNYVQGIVSHGVHIKKDFSVIHAGHGTISIGLIPRIPFDQMQSGEGNHSKKGENDALWGPSAGYLLQTLSSIPVLAAVPVTPTELLQCQLEKLVVNSILNPLTVLLDCRNNALLHNFALSRTIYLLLAETCLVFQSLPELKGIPNVEMRFSPQRLERIFVNVAEKTGDNISSMLQDARKGNKTEIEYMNGYIVRRGEQLGIRPVLNYMMMQMVLGKRKIIRDEIDGYVPSSRNDTLIN